MKKNNKDKIIILILTILVLLDILVTYFLNKKGEEFKFEKIMVFNEKIKIEKNKRVYQIKMNEKTLTCKIDNSKYDKVFDISIKNKNVNGIEIVKEKENKIYYYGYLDSKVDYGNTSYFDFLIEVDVSNLKISDECKIEK